MMRWKIRRKFSRLIEDPSDILLSGETVMWYSDWVVNRRPIFVCDFMELFKFLFIISGRRRKKCGIRMQFASHFMPINNVTVHVGAVELHWVDRMEWYWCGLENRFPCSSNRIDKDGHQHRSTTLMRGGSTFFFKLVAVHISYQSKCVKNVLVKTPDRGEIIEWVSHEVRGASCGNFWKSGDATPQIVGNCMKFLEHSESR